MNRALTLTVPAMAICLTSLAAHAAAASDPLIDALDLTRPELAPVKAAAEHGDYPAARMAFADYLRNRTNVRWHFDPANPPKELTPEELALAKDALKHRFSPMDVPYQFTGSIDWKFNPTTLPDSKVAVTHEWVWVLNRHQYWPAMAKAYLATGDVAFAQEASRQIADWCVKNPVPAKPGNRYFSPWRQIEAGIRMGGSWPDTYFTLLKHPDVFPDDTLLAMVDAMRGHAEYLDQYPTLGNHKTMEMNGLFHVGVLFPEFKDAAKWRQDGITRQRDEIGIQVYPDGVQFELTSSYHDLALQMFFNSYRLAVLNNIPTPAGYKEALEKMFAMNLWAMLPDRTTPGFNDSDREPVIPMLQQGLQIFPQRADWKWIITDGKEGTTPAHTSHFFPYAGWAAMRSDWSRDARCLIMEGGPFGYGHQHEDKLSFIVDAYGARLVAEAGIYPYFVSQARDYSISAQGHNVLSVDGLQQHRKGRSRETYLSKAPLDLNWRTSAGFDYVEAAYGAGRDETWGDAKTRGFVHTRRVLFAKPDYWVVIDSVTPPDDRTHRYESAFHLNAPDAHVDTPSQRVTTTGTAGPRIAIVPLPAPGLEARIIAAQKEPELLGWIANDTLELQPAPTACFSRRAQGPVHMLYVFAPAPTGQEPPVARVELTNDVPGAAIAATIVFSPQPIYGHGVDKVYLTADGEVVMQRDGGATFSSRG